MRKSFAPKDSARATSSFCPKVLRTRSCPAIEYLTALIGADLPAIPVTPLRPLWLPLPKTLRWKVCAQSGRARICHLPQSQASRHDFLPRARLVANLIVDRQYSSCFSHRLISFFLFFYKILCFRNTKKYGS